MPEIYRSLLSGRVEATTPRPNALGNVALRAVTRPFGPLTPVQRDRGAQEMAQTPGGQMMLRERPADFAQLMRAYIKTFGGTYRWNPGKGAPRSGDVLDGTASEGECRIFAMDLMAIACAPRPYGLGLDPFSLNLVRYAGAGNQGFISSHPRAGVLGLLPNVSRFDSSADGLGPQSALYSWADHKVVQYQGKFWDPSYGTTYTRIQEMAQFEVVACVQAAGHMFDKTSRAGRIWYFRYATPRDHLPPHQSYIGPIPADVAKSLYGLR
jgi:hypothetical protein